MEGPNESSRDGPIEVPNCLFDRHARNRARMDRKYCIRSAPPDLRKCITCAEQRCAGTRGGGTPYSFPRQGIPTFSRTIGMVSFAIAAHLAVPLACASTTRDGFALSSLAPA